MKLTLNMILLLVYLIETMTAYVISKVKRVVDFNFHKIDGLLPFVNIDIDFTNHLINACNIFVDDVRK